MTEAPNNFFSRATHAIQHLFWGRISRLQFVIAGLLAFILPILLILFFLVVTVRLSFPLAVASILYNLEAVILLALLFVASGLYVRRLHDMSWPGWIVSFQLLNVVVGVLYLTGLPTWALALLLLVPFLNGIVFLALLFWPSERDANKYGHPSRVDRSIQNVIFGRNGQSNDQGEAWLARTLFGLSMFSILLYVLAQTNVPVYFGITSLHPGVIYTVNGKQIRVPFGDVTILCGSEEINIAKAPPFPDLSNVLSQAISTCGGNFDANFLYGTNNVYDVFSRSSGWFSLSQRYVVVLTRKMAGQENLNDYELAIYKTVPALSKVYSDDLGSIPKLKGWPGDGISFEDVNKDGRIDLQVCLPVPGHSNCRTYFDQPDTDTFVRWINAERDTNASYSVEAQVIYFDGAVIPDVDLISFAIINDQYAKDRYHVYSFGTILPGVDPASFEVMDLSSLGQYTKDKDHAYFSGGAIAGADSATFTYIDGNYSRDKNSVYEGDRQIIGADPSTFQIVSESSNMFRWSKDKNHVYYEGVALDNVFPEYFKAADSDFGTDGLNVFYGIRAIDGSRADTFTIVKFGYPSYAKDANQVYFGGAVDSSPVIVGADPMTFAVVGNNYSRDERHVFYKLTAISGADPRTIMYLGNADGSEYARDKSFVYRDGKVIPDANPNTFILSAESH